MQTTTATRKDLLDKRVQLQLAIQGRDLIEQKRNALVQELMKMVDMIMQDASELDNKLNDARRALGNAETIVGSQVLRSVAMAMRDEFSLETKFVRLMGVEIAEFEPRHATRSMLGRGYSITGTSSTIDEAALAFETVVEAIVRQAESEMRLKHLAREIQTTARRLNALDMVLIPRIRGDIVIIETALDELERADNYRLRLAKRLLTNKRDQLV